MGIQYPVNNLLSPLPHSTYKLSDSEFKTPRISPILKSAKIKHFTVFGLLSNWVLMPASLHFHNNGMDEHPLERKQTYFD